MKIIGGRDYYDSAMAYGRDDDVVFIRDSWVIPASECPLWSGYKHDIIKGHYWQDAHISYRAATGHIVHLNLLPVSIYVAGKHYGGIKVERNSLEKIEVFWDHAKLESWVQGLGKELMVPDPRRDRWQFRAIDSPFTDLRSFMAPRDATTEQVEWLVQNRVAIAIWCDHNTDHPGRRKPFNWYCNPGSKEWSLAAYDFPRVMDPYTLFQELSMFVGGVLPRNPNPMVEITDDKVKVAKHGFDKWSFRKHKDDA